MKLKNIFKKIVKVTAKSSVQTLDKKQLEKVIGGVETRGDSKPVKALDGNPTI